MIFRRPLFGSATSRTYPLGKSSKIALGVRRAESLDDDPVRDDARALHYVEPRPALQARVVDAVIDTLRLAADGLPEFWRVARFDEDDTEIIGSAIDNEVRLVTRQRGRPRAASARRRQERHLDFYERRCHGDHSR